MPRPRKRLAVDERIPPITPEEVEAMWHKATTHAPFPSPQANKQIAEILTLNRAHGAWNHIRSDETVPIKDLLRLSRKTLFNYLQPIEKASSSFPADTRPDAVGTSKAWKGKPAAEISSAPADTWILGLFAADYDKLKNILIALDEALPVIERLSTRDAPPHAPVWDMAVHIAWAVAQEALQVLGRPVGTSPNAVAVKFTALAAQHMGFPDATPSAISKHLIKISKKSRHSDATQLHRCN